MKNVYDGTGNSIHIPTIIINGQDGLKLIELMIQQYHEPLQLKAEFEISNQYAAVVVYELFYESIVDLPLPLILELYEYQHALKQSAVFIPRLKMF